MIVLRYICKESSIFRLEMWEILSISPANMNEKHSHLELESTEQNIVSSAFAHPTSFFYKNKSCRFSFSLYYRGIWLVSHFIRSHMKKIMLLITWAEIILIFFYIMITVIIGFFVLSSYHIAEKKIPSIHGFTNGIKLEQFIFDAFTYAPSMSLFEVIFPPLASILPYILLF